MDTMIFPYDGIKETCEKYGITTDYQSWPSSKGTIFQELMEETNPETIFEIGSWKGGSAIQMARIAKERGLGTKVVCIDTWLGSSEHFVSGQRDYLFPTDPHGHPLLYWQFLLNVVDSGMQEYIVPMLATSMAAAIRLGKEEKKAELIYVDGSHDYESVYLDLQAYVLLLKDSKSVIFGDDFHLDAVRAAVIRFAFEFQFKVEYVKETNHFVLRQK